MVSAHHHSMFSPLARFVSAAYEICRGTDIIKIYCISMDDIFIVLLYLLSNVQLFFRFNSLGVILHISSPLLLSVIVIFYCMFHTLSLYIAYL
jgi:hypothetical protein